MWSGLVHSGKRHGANNGIHSDDIQISLLISNPFLTFPSKDEPELRIKESFQDSIVFEEQVLMSHMK